MKPCRQLNSVLQYYAKFGMALPLLQVHHQAGPVFARLFSARVKAVLKQLSNVQSISFDSLLDFSSTSTIFAKLWQFCIL